MSEMKEQLYQCDQFEKSLISLNANSLQQVFPDIQGELCSKHSTLLNQIKNKFMNLYDGYQLDRFIILNKIISFVADKQLFSFDIKMALQNGIIVAFAKTANNQPLFINGTIFNEQLLYKFNGQHKQGNHKLQSQISSIIKLANSDLSLAKMNGGLIYIHNNISQNSKNFQQLLLLGVFIAILCINDQQNILTMREIIEKLAQNQIFNKAERERSFLQEQFLNFRKRNLKLIYKNCLQAQFQQIKLNKKTKFIIYDFGLPEKQNELQIQKQKDFNKRVIQQDKSQHQNNEKLHTQIKKIYQKVNQLKAQKISLENFIQDLQKIQQKQIYLYSKQLMQRANQIRKLAHIENSIIVDSRYLLVPVSSSFCLQKLRQIRKIMTNQIQNPQSLQKRFGNSPHINQLIFSASGSKSISIFNPKTQIWFK